MCLTRQKISGHDSRSYSHDLWNDEEKEKTKERSRGRFDKEEEYGDDAVEEDERRLTAHREVEKLKYT